MSDDVLEVHASSNELADLSFSGDSTNHPVLDESQIFKIEGLSPTEFPSTEESIRSNPKYWISLIRSSKEHQALIGKLQTTCVFFDENYAASLRLSFLLDSNLRRRFRVNEVHYAF